MNDATATESTSDSVEADSKGNASGRSFSLWPRFRILTLILLASVVCVWSWYFQLTRINIELAENNAAMTAFTRDLLIVDENRLSVVRQLPSWYDESIWKLYIPKGKSYKLHLATREISRSVLDNPGYKPPPVAQTTLEAGTYKIELRQEEVEDGERVVVLIGDEEVLSHKETEDKWDPGHGSTGGAYWDRPEQPEDDDTVLLFRRRFTLPTGSGGYQAPFIPTNGIELRLEKN